MVTTQYVERMKNVARGHRLEIPDPEGVDLKTHIEMIRFLLNQEVYGSAQDWMMPRWAFNTLKKHKGQKDKPLLNSQHCNCALIGGVGGRYAGLTDEAGLVRANPECGSLEFWIHDRDKIIFPALDMNNRLELTAEEDQLYTWSHHIGAVEFCRHIYHVQENGHEAIYNEIEIRNKSLSDTRLTFFAVVRPMSVLGVEPLIDLVYDEQTNRLYANGTLALESDKKPTAIIMTTTDNPNLLVDAISMFQRWDTQFHTARGLATAVLRFDLNLCPAQTATIFFVQPLNQIREDDTYSFRKDSEIRYESIGNWFEFMNDTISVTFPDTQLDGIFKMSKATLAIQARYALGGDSDLREGERARVLLALCQIGAVDLAQTLAIPLIDRVLDAIKKNERNHVFPLALSILQLGKYNHSSEYYSTIRRFVENLSMTIKDKLLADTAEHTRQQVTTEIPSSLIATTSPSPLEGFADPENSEPITSEHEMPMQEVAQGAIPEEESMEQLVAMKWLLLIGWELVDALDAMGERSQAEEVYNLCERYSEYVEKKWSRGFDLLRIQDKKERIKHILNIFDIVILSMRDCIPDHVIDECALTMRTSLMKKGLLKNPEREEERAIYLTLQLAQLYSLHHDSDSIETLLSYVVKTASTYHTLPDKVGDEGIPQLERGSMIRSAIESLLLIRLMLAKEENENLVVLGGIPEDWFLSAKELSALGIPTSVGKLDISLGTSANQYQIDIQMEDLPQELQIHVTNYRAINTYKVYGGSLIERIESPISSYLRIIPLSDNVIVTYHK
ncbi:MAG: hypothetical protein K9W43_05360 [Candidatus Thorarchaeota archaeon]|nr:hypothetical protein [Candidatus Thorarchaeota archaeon]